MTTNNIKMYMIGSSNLFLLCMFICLSVYNSNGQGERMVKDIDGNEYKTIVIGHQVWMAENLRTTKLRDGTKIPEVKETEDWWNRETPAYSWYTNDRDKYEHPYGAYYNWYTVHTSKLCPSGWHVPTEAEWNELIGYLGGEESAANKLRVSGTEYWNGPNTLSDNEAGFCAVAAGFRYFRGFYPTGINGTWWSADEHSSQDAWYRTIDYKFSSVDRYYYHKSTGFSVRCVQDKKSVK